MIQFTSRGRRNAPVKKMRARCVTIAATKISAAQWWICRISSPALTTKLSCMTESKALETVAPRSGTYGPP